MKVEYDRYTGAREYCKEVSHVACCEEMAEAFDGWLEAYKLAPLITGVSNKKPLATCYLDDRAVNFNGDWTDALAALVNFKTHWE